jgi:hypothetical protein
VTVQPFESTAPDRDNWSGYWSVCAESARENPAQQMHYKLLLAARSRCCLMLAVAKETFCKVVQTGGDVRRCVGFEPSEVGVSVSPQGSHRNISSGGIVRAAS